MPLAVPARAIATGLAGAVRWALPPRCPGCGVPVGEDHRFCGTCWGGLHFLGPPWCEGCCAPMPYTGPGLRCARCIAGPPRHAGVRAAVAYGPVARSLALRLKYGGRLGLATTMARAMTRLVPGEAELLVPVPLHRWRLWRRGFNQAGLIAGAVSRGCGVPVAHHALVRPRATQVLRGLGPKARAKAVARGFAVASGAEAAIRGRVVVLVDDVHASGATASACTATLLAAGARSVTILCWARVLDPAD